MGRVYRWYHDVLKLIQFPETGRRWILKYPPHLRCLKELFAEFPEACVIQTHRDPARVVPSYASLLAHFSQVYEENVDQAAIGALSAKLWSDRLAKGIQDREDLGRESQFYDLHFRDVLADPIGSLAKAFGAFGMDLSETALERMDGWNSTHKPGRHGSHDYTAETFGLDASELTARFAPYRERFGVEAE